MGTASVELRQGVLAVSVLDDIPVQPDRDGVRLGTGWVDPHWVAVSWSRLDQALAGVEPMSDVGRARLRDWMRVRLAVGQPGVAASVLPLALPVGHALHPGADWVRERVLGGVLDVGLGLRVEGTLPGRAPVLALAPGAADDAGVDPGTWWPAARERLDALGALAVERLQRDGGGRLTPVGGCDVLTLLGSRSLRAYLAAGDGTGMRAVAAPMRSRAWFDLAHSDPAFVVAAAAATDAEHRGVARPMLVTADEVALAPTGPPGRARRAWAA